MERYACNVFAPCIAISSVKHITVPRLCVGRDEGTVLGSTILCASCLAHCVVVHLAVDVRPGVCTVQRISLGRKHLNVPHKHNGAAASQQSKGAGRSAEGDEHDGIKSV
eukprot:3019632-Pyramimonas_sp.AAC.1